MDDEYISFDQTRDLTIASLDEESDVLERDKLALEPVRVALRQAGFYAYTTFDDQQRWSVAVDDEDGRVDVRVGMDGYEIDLQGTSPGMFADEENEWKRRTLARLVRIVLPNIARGSLAENQTTWWDDVDQGIAVRISYEVPFTRGDSIGLFVRERMPELEILLTTIETQIDV